MIIYEKIPAVELCQFYRPVFDGTYHGIASSICLFGPCRPNLRCRILQLCNLISLMREKIPNIVFQGLRSKFKGVLSHSRKTWQDTL